MENTKFIKRVDHIEIPISGKVEIDLNDLRKDFGANYNTLIITNADAASDIEIYINSVKAAFVTANNGGFSIDKEDGVIFNSIAIENTNAAATIAANNVKVSVGRTGAV